MNRNLPFFISILIFVACQTQQPTTYLPKRQGPLGDSAMVSTAHPLATEVGLEILRKGGNAFDAGIAVHFALAVVFPEAGNIGGGGFAVYRKANGETGSLDFREKAPKAAYKEMYQDSAGNVMQMASRIGHLAAGVPGSVAGMWALHQHLGKLPWQELLQPAVRLAYKGYLLTQYSADNLNEKQEDFLEANRYVPWTINEDGWKKGDSIIQKELAATLTQIQNKGRDGFYKGIVADQIEKEMTLGNGLITKEDLEAYEPVWRDPLTYDYKGHQIITMPPPSSGGVALIQLLQGAKQMKMASLNHNSADYVHLMTELERRVYADRATHLGDPDYYDVPVKMLLSEAYNQERYSDINMKKKTPSEEIKEGEVEIIESVQTTHYSIADLEGNALSVTTTINSFYGCKVMVRGGGFFLNNEMNDFSAKPGVPNQFGLIGAEANSIEPEKRMLSSMTPTLVEKDQELFMIVGTPGGSTIITQVFQVIMNVIDHGMTMQDAVDARRTHHQWLPEHILVESGTLSHKDSLALTQKGHEIINRGSWGRVDAVLVKNDSTYEGAADDTRGSDDFANGF